MPLMGKQMEVHETADDMSFAAVIQDQDVPPATNQDATEQESQQAAQTVSQTPVVRTNFNETAFSIRGFWLPKMAVYAFRLLARCPHPLEADAACPHERP